MAEKLLKFISVEQGMPQKRKADERAGDFHEIYAEFITEKANEQASRCSQCGVPFCQSGCPLQNNIPDWLRLTAEGRLQEAYEVSAATNMMPEVCGRICPQDRLCEGSCVIEQSGHGAVTIGAVEKYLTETAWTEGWVKPITPIRERAGSVGIIGSGPAGLAAAEMLRRKGWSVTIYERADRAGGLLMYGIPGFKLEKQVVERRIERLEQSGIVFKLNTEIGTDISFAELRSTHDAVLIATGVYKARELDVPGAGAAGVVPALDFLITANKKGLGDAVDPKGKLSAKGKDVVVIGGGDTAMDCVRTAIRQGAESVRCLYRRDRKNMPGSQREVKNAEEEGVVFEWLAAPKAVLGDAKKAKGVRAARMRLGAADASGRQSPEPIEGADFDAPADLVIKALGFDPEDLKKAFRTDELILNRWGAVRINPVSMETNLPGVYAAGDIARGASLVVWAIRDGMDAANSIHDYLLKVVRTKVAAE